jgi:hypothetical protein
MSVKTFKEGIKLEPQSADPTATEGQVQFSDGTARPKGLFQYKDGAWSSIGGGAGDADTIHLIKASDSQASDFTIKSIDDIMPDPEGSDTLSGTFSIPTTGSEALLSNDDDHKVFKYASAASSQYDAFGITKAIPRYIRGEDVVLQFKYRTADTSGDSANADYMIWLWDKTNGQNETTTSSGSISAGTAITIGSSTGMSVGDKIWVGETGGTSQVTEAHITEITSGTQIKISEDVNLTSGDRFVTGMLTDVLTTLDAADDDTNKTGNDYKVVANIPSDCAQVTLLFQQLTSQTDSFLFVDNILVSSEVVKRVETQKKPYFVKGAGNGTTSITADVTPIDFTEVTDDDNLWSGTVYTVPANGSYSFTGCVNTGNVTAYIKLFRDTGGGYAHEQTISSQTLSTIHVFSGDVYLNKGDLVQLRMGGASTTLANNSMFHHLSITATPQKGTAIIVESTDSVISEWTDFTPTVSSGFGTITNSRGKWRRVGDSMEIEASFTAGTVSAVEAQFNLPSGYYLDTGKVNSAADLNSLGVWSRITGISNYTDAGFSGHLMYEGSNSYLTLSTRAATSTTMNQNITNTTIGTGDSVILRATVPIAGWDANPKPLLAFPTITYGQDAEHAAYHTRGDADGLASTNTKIVFFATETTNTISNLGTITNSATTGFDFTATARCKVKATASLAFTTASWFGWTKNSSQLTTNFTGVTDSQQYGPTYSPANETTSSPFEGILEAGDTIRVHCDGATVQSNKYNCGVTLLVEPEEGRVNQAAIIAQPVAFVKDVKASGTDGGTFTSGAWQTRDLTQLSGDIAAVGVTLSSNQFTLPAGKYVIEAKAPSFNVAYNKSAIYNITDSNFVEIGTEAYSGADNTTFSFVDSVVTITKSTTFELQHRCETTNATIGFGITNVIPEVSVYSIVKITRMK